MLTVHNINIPDSSVTMRIKNGANNPCLVKTKISNILTETDVVINGKVQEGARFEPTKELDARNFEIYTSRILSKNPNYELVAGGLSLRSILNNKPITSFIEMMEEIQLHYSGAWIKKTFYIVDKRNNNVIEPIIRLELQVSERSFYKYRQVYIKNISGMTVILTKNEDYTPASQHRFLDGNYNPVTFVRKRYEITESQVPDYVNKKYIVVLDPKTKIYYVLTQEWIEKSNSY
jgi:hypothetical protein